MPYKPNQINLGGISMIREINVHEHQVRMDDYSTYSQIIKEIVKAKLVHADLDVVDVFNMKGTDTGIQTGGRKRLVILANHPQSNENGIIITHPETGVKIADFIDNGSDVQQLNISCNVFGTHNPENVALFTHIMEQLDVLVYHQRVLDYSWKYTSKRGELTARFTGQIKKAQLAYLEDDKRKIERIEEDIRSYTRDLKTKYDNRIRLQRNIETAQTKLESVDQKLIADLDAIIHHPKVKDLMIQGELFIVETEPIYAYHDKNGSRYYIGNMRIELNPNNTDVKFFGDNPRRSHWTAHDPHPHVNGSNGHACLGNIASTIAELSSQMELYALTMICIDFLESVNTEDSAGRHITNWDQVDEDGNVIDPSEEVFDDDSWMCDHCEEQQPGDDGDHRVYRHVDEDGELEDERYVCNECYEEHYHYSEHYDEYVHNDIEEPEED